MTHTVCGQPIIWDELAHPWEPIMRRMVPYCVSCQREVTDDTELSAGRPWELVEDKPDGA